eukprot:gene36034-44443_t
MQKHGHSLAEDLNQMMQMAAGRRKTLRWMMASAAALPMLGCGGSSGSSDSTASTGSTGTTGTTATGSCTVIPEETGGPYPGDGTNSNSSGVVNVLTQSGVVRRDIRSSFGGATGVAAGVLLTIKLKIQNANNSCGAAGGFAVYLWHCDRDGNVALERVRPAPVQAGGRHVRDLAEGEHHPGLAFLHNEGAAGQPHQRGNRTDRADEGDRRRSHKQRQHGRADRKLVHVHEQAKKGRGDDKRQSGGRPMGGAFDEHGDQQWRFLHQHQIERAVFALRLEQAVETEPDPREQVEVGADTKGNDGDDRHEEEDADHRTATGANGQLEVAEEKRDHLHGPFMSLPAAARSRVMPQASADAGKAGHAQFLGTLEPERLVCRRDDDGTLVEMRIDQAGKKPVGAGIECCRRF